MNIFFLDANLFTIKYCDISPVFNDRPCQTEKVTMQCHLKDISNVIKVPHTISYHPNKI